MSDSKQIMVAVDFSDYALPSVRYAAHLARKLGEGLLLVNAINRRDVDMMKSVAAAYPGFVVETYLAENRKDRTALMEKLIAGANCEGLQVDIEIRVGVPYEVLLEVIDELIAAPSPSLPIHLIKPEAYYLYVDEELEALTAGQKVLLRMGPDNAARVKAKLAEIRNAL